jgi:hypothetical protein
VSKDGADYGEFRVRLRPNASPDRSALKSRKVEHIKIHRLLKFKLVRNFKIFKYLNEKKEIVMTGQVN